jgi:hypothetical protein
MTPVAVDDFRLLDGDEHLTEYQFGQKKVQHYFCRHCGIHTFHVTGAGAYVVNVACLTGVDPESLNPIWSDGRSR